MTKENKPEEKKESATEKVLNSILEKGLSIVDKVLGKIDEKLDDEEFMEKLEKYAINVTVNTEETVEEETTDWETIAKEDKAKTDSKVDPELLTDKQKAELNLDPAKTWRWIKKTAEENK